MSKQNNIKLSRRGFLKSLGAMALAASPAAAALSSLTSCSVRGSGEKVLTILHTNDVHSRIDPYPADIPNYGGLGGYARRKALIDSMRSRVGAENMMVFECGDMFQGTPYFNFYGGKLEIKLMNEMHVDAVTIGNHEFDNGVEALCNCIRKANFPYLCANYLFAAHWGGTSVVPPYKIFERAGVRIGVFGLGVKLDGLVNARHSVGVTYLDPVPTAQKMADMLRAQGCELVIALSHMGHEMRDEMCDTKLAALTSGIDIILGGHTHTFLPQPVFVDNAQGRPVCINQVGFGGINVGILTVRLIEGVGPVVADSRVQVIDGSLA